MSKKKGLSVEEKKSRMLDLLYEKKDFFQLKELEKIAPKEKGIIVQSVKDIIQNLVDDGLVDSEKIGTSVYFWAFPSKAAHQKKRKLEELEGKIKTLQEALQKTNENILKAKVGREETEERQKHLTENKKLKAENKSLSNEIQKYKDSDPEAFDKMKNDTVSIKESANRWTDNVFSVKSWCKNKFNIEENVLNKQFNIPEEMDYID